MAPEELPDSARRELLENLDEELYRQVHPNLIGDDGLPSSGAFTPSSNDAGELSVARSALTTPQDAYELHTTGYNLESAGTWAVTAREVIDAGRSSFADPLEGDEATGQPSDPAHAFIDFRGLGRNPARRVALALKGFANARSSRYLPDAS